MSDAPSALSSEALKISESRYRRLFETARDGILLLNADTAQIEDVNPYLIEMLGYSHAEFLGKKLWEVGAFADRAESKEMFAVLQAKGYVRYDDLPLKAKDGTEIPVEFVSNSYDCAGITVIQCNIRNISERKANLAKIERHTHLYSALSQCNKAIVYASSQEELFQQVCHAAVEFGGMQMAWIGIIDTKTKRVIPVASFGKGVEYLRNIEVSADFKSPFGNGPIGTAIRESKPFWCQDFKNDPITAPWQKPGIQYGWAASASLPLHRGDDVIGVFVVYSDKLNAFDASARNLLSEMATDIGFALDNFAHEAARQATEQELRIAATAFEAQEAILVTDAHKVILRANRSFTKMTGYDTDEIIGKTPALMHSGKHGETFYNEMWAALSKDHYWHGELWNRHKNGEIFPVWTTITAVTGHKGNICNYVSFYSDLSQHKKDEDSIHDLAFYDPLTHLPNRRLLIERIQHAFAASRHHQHHVAVMFIDIDNFKTLNDTKGHNVGDLLLLEVTKRLQGCVHEGDTVARFGGDDFVVMLEDLSENMRQAAVQVEMVSQKILSTLALPYELDGYEYHSSASIGISLLHDQDVAVDELLKRADTALYQAKSAGRNTLRFYDPAMQIALETRTALERDLRNALAQKQFTLYYQSQVDGLGHIMGAEVLIRWHHPEKNIVTPAAFIPLAEETGLILPIGRWVLETACQQLKAWASEVRTRNLILAVNISAKQFQQTDFVEQVLQVLAQTGADPALLKLELTESMLVDDIDTTIIKMATLKAKGIRFSLDDFGTGFSSLSYLKKLPLDQLKIDQSFVRDVNKNPSDAAIVRTVIALGQSLGLAVIAEGVETDEQRNLLAVLGCNQFQGYLFSRPIPLADFEVLLRKA